MFSTDSSQDDGGDGCGNPTGTSGWDASESMDMLKAGSRFMAKLLSSGKLKRGEGSALDNGPPSFEDEIELEISVTMVGVLSY